MTKKLAPKKAYQTPRTPVHPPKPTPELSPEPKRTATILFQQLPEKMTLIVGFQNFLSKEEMALKYGVVVTKAYEAYPSHMFKRTRVTSVSSCLYTSVILSDSGVEDIEPNMVLSNKDFGKLYARVKKCGELLHKIRICYKENPIKSLSI